MRKSKNARTKQKLAQKAAQKKRRRGKSKDRGQGQTLAPTFHMLRNPFEGLSDDQRRSAIEEIARNSEEKYQEALSELKAILRRHDPLLVLSHMSFYGLSVAIDETAGLTKRDGDYEMFPYHVEILQALLLQIPPEELSGKPFGPQVLTQVWDQVKTLCDVHNFRQSDPAGVQLRDDEMAVALAQHRMRSATQVRPKLGLSLPDQAYRTRTLLSVRRAAAGSPRVFCLGRLRCLRDDGHPSRVQAVVSSQHARKSIQIVRYRRTPFGRKLP